MQMVPNELAVSSISPMVVPPYIDSKLILISGASRFSDVSVKMILSQFRSFNIFLTSFTSAGDMLPVIMFIFPFGTDLDG